MSVSNLNLGINVQIPYPELCNIHSCSIGSNSSIGSFTEIQPDVHIGKNCTIQSHCFISSQAHIGNNVSIGNNVILIGATGLTTYIEDNVIIGPGAIITCGITLHKNCIIAPRAVVTRDVLPGWSTDDSGGC